MDTADSVKSRICDLRRSINEHNYRYHTVGAPKITDFQFDSLFQELVRLEKENPGFADPDSPTSRVGHPTADGFAKVRHLTRMLSLDNVFSAAEVLKFFGTGETVSVEPKVDGCSLELVYEKGVLVAAATRGDGAVGDDVTANVRTIRNVPLNLAEKATLRVRGEVYMSFTVFNQINAELAEEGDDLLANPRNAAAGAIKLKDPYEVYKRRLSFTAYGSPTEFSAIQTQAGLLSYLKMLGFTTVTSIPVIHGFNPPLEFLTILRNEDTVAAVINSMRAYCKALDCATDGLVFKHNSIVAQRDLGEGTRAPKWAVAYKFPPERKATRLVAITVTVGKTGRCTPNAELTPVALSGTTVSAASLCNQNEIERLGINVGDDVYVEKSAEIIPKVVGIFQKNSEGSWKMPSSCPSCQQPITRADGFVDHYCENKECPEQVFARIRHAVGKGSLDIDGCGDVTVRALIEHGVRTLSDIFSISDLNFLKTAARKKFLSGREAAKLQPFWRKIHALGIDGVGRTVSQEIAGRWNSLAAVFNDLPQLKEVIGESLFESWVQWFDKNAEEIDRLSSVGFHLEKDARSVGPLTGKFFVITGTLSSGTRGEVVRRIEDAGGLVKGSVSKKVHYLVAGSDCGRTKTEAAQRVGTVVIDEDQLYQMLGMPMPAIMVNVDPEHEF